MKHIVTGAAGFVGSTVVSRLLDLGAEVVGIDSFTDYYDPAIKEARVAPLVERGLTLVRGDLNSIPLDETLAGASVIYHQAGQPGVRRSWGDEFSVYTRDNVDATQRLLEAARRVDGLERFVYASSSSVYGNAERFPTHETDAPRPLSPYGVTKLAAEHLCTLYAENFGLPTVSLRYFTVYGPGQRPDMAFTRFVTAAVTGTPITIYGSGEQVRDFTYVDDIVRANLLAGSRPVEPGSVFNVAGGTSISVNGVLELLAELNDGALDVSYTDRAAGDVTRTGGSTERIQDALGWQPEVDLEDGLRTHLEWARDRFAQ